MDKWNTKGLYIKNGIQIAKKLADLYVTYRKKYIVQYYNNEKKDITYKEVKAVKGFKDSLLLKHIRQETTIGIFSGAYITSFMCFDVDIPNVNMAKWAVYKLVHTLQEIGIPGEYIYISESGSKGYHVELFFDNPVQNSDVHKLYMMVLNAADLLNINYGDIELRPFETKTGTTLGMKLPLGVNQKTGNTCWFCSFENSLQPIKDYNYILSIKQMPKEIFLDIMQKNEDIVITPVQQEQIERITDKYKPLPEYRKNIDEDYTIEEIEKLIENGLVRIGTRHNALFNIAKYNKHCGLQAEDNINFLIAWMQQQEPSTYTTSWEGIINDIKEIIEYIYNHNCSFTVKNTRVQVNLSEISKILDIEGKNERLLLYAMLIHSKRYAGKQGVFFMTKTQMMKTTGLSDKTIKTIRKKLEEKGIITIKRSKAIKFNKIYNKPMTETNRYKINFFECNSDISDDTNTFKVCDKDCEGCFNACLCKMYSNKELKVKFARRQYDEIKKYRDYCVNL